MFSFRPTALAVCLLASCAPPASAEPWLTILDAPPAPFTPVASEAPAKTPEQVAAEKRFWDYARWQSGVQGEAATVHNRLRRAEKGNYVDMRFESESEPFTVVFAFLRDGPATLRKYVKRPEFVGETVRWSKAEQAAAGEATLAFFRKHKINVEGGWGNKENRPIFRVGITEGEYRALAAKHGFTLPEPVLLTFTDRPASARNQPLPPDVAKGIKLFARATQPVGPVEDTSTLVTVQLRSGCFRLKGDGAHVVFPLGYTLHRDAAGYLTFGAAGEKGNAKVGEEAKFHGILREVRDDALVREVRTACGEGRVVAVNALKSAAAERLQEREAQRRWLRRSLGESYGLSPRGIEAFIADCEKSMSVCREVPPPPPSGKPCPAGTSLKHGLCRTPQGHIRPLPAHLEPYAKL